MEWREDWFTTLCLIIALAAVVFLMLLSIYLVMTKPEPSLIPDKDVGDGSHRSVCACKDIIVNGGDYGLMVPPVGFRGA